MNFFNRNKTKLASLVAAGSAGYYIYQYINGEFVLLVLIVAFTTDLCSVFNLLFDDLNLDS